MRGSHDRPQTGNADASAAIRSPRLRRSINKGSGLGLTAVPLDPRTAAVKSRPRHPLLSDRRDESLEHYIHTLQAQSLGAERAKAAILANLSHEFRTPLNAIIGFSELLLSEMSGPLDGERQREYVGDIRNSGLQLLHMLDCLLDNADRASETETFDAEIANPCKIISDVCESLEPIADARGVIVNLQLRDSGVDFALDPGGLYRAVKHVLMMVIRQSSIGDTVTIDVSSDADALNLSITDPVTRRGIAPPADQSDDIDPCETDFSLSIAEKIFKQHDGDIEFRANPNGGWTLRLTLPNRASP